MEKENNSNNKGIKGLVTFFLFQLGLCAVILVMSFISNYNPDYDTSVPEAVIVLRNICDVISIIAIAICAIIVIRSFIKRELFSTQLAMSYLFALFLNANRNMLELLLSYNVDIINLLDCVMGMVWFSIWLIYLYNSKQIEELFPIQIRISRKKDYLPIVLIAFPPIIMDIIFFTY